MSCLDSSKITSARDAARPQPVRATDLAHADLAYLRLFALAADFGEDPVSELIGALLREGELPLPAAIEPQLHHPMPTAPAMVTPFVPELRSYDGLITEVAS